MGSMWRFFQNEMGKWKWQQVSLDRAVLNESTHEFHDYDACVNDAIENGYRFAPSQPCTARARHAPVTMFQ